MSEEKIELTKKECDEIAARQQIVQFKRNELNRLATEEQLLKESLKQFFNSLIDKYNLDKKKNYQFNGTELVEVQMEEPTDVRSKDKVQSK